MCQCETGACQYHWCSIYRGLERVGSWVPGGSVGRDQLAMAAKVRRHWFNPCRLGSRGHLGADFSLLLYTDLIKKRKPSRHITDEGELIRELYDPFQELPAPSQQPLLQPMSKMSNRHRTHHCLTKCPPSVSADPVLRRLHLAPDSLWFQ